ncbi:MAG: hypothetical protein RTU63_00610 [Candidatus Thorarchaeota archaeon]
MRKTSRILALMFVAFMILGSTQVQTVTDANQPMSTQVDILSPAGFNSPNITASLVDLANGSTVSGSFDIRLNMTSDFANLNLTLFVDSAIIFPAYNETLIATGSPFWIETITVDSTLLSEGMLNFTVLFENLAEKETVYLLYYVDNDAFDISATLTTPANESEISGLVQIDLNVVSDVDTLDLTLFVDGEIYSTESVGTGDISVIVDTSTLIEGYDNFTLFFEYDMLATYFSYTMYLEYLIDNDDEPITIDHQSPANQTEVSGVFDLYLEIGSEYEPLEFTLFVEGAIHKYNQSSLGIKNQIISINTTELIEGPLNFTLFFYYNVTGEDASATYTLVFDVNNHAGPIIVVLDPIEDSTVTGLTDLWLNITTTHPQVFLNVTVDGVNTAEFNGTAIMSGAFNYTFNSSKFENGNHLVGIVAYTGEDASSSTPINLIFLDHVRMWISSLASHDTISGLEEFRLRVETPYDNATASFYIDGNPVASLQDVMLYPGSNFINFNTTLYDEGEHEIMIIASDDFGHEWQATMILEIDNKGAPNLRYTTSDAVVIGVASFTIDVDSAWDELTVEIYVDDEIVPAYNNVSVDVSSGSFTFTIDVAAYGKTEHTVRVVMTTPEGDVSEVDRVFGFASIRIEEIVSLGILVGLALIIPLIRKRQGYSIRTVLLVDAIFAAVVIGAFFVLGISTMAFLLWHVNLASIWAIGGILVFTNWALPFLVEEPEE